MEQYVSHLPYFIVFVGLGIAVNLINKKVKGEVLTILRIVDEVISSIWIALLVAGGLMYFTEWSNLVIYGVSSVAGYFNSTLIDKVGKGIIEYLLPKVKQLMDTGTGSAVAEETEEP